MLKFNLKAPASEKIVMQHIACAQMLAYRANPQYTAQPADVLAELAVKDAKALIAALNKEEEDNGR